jgi:hypothetical protein
MGAHACQARGRVQLAPVRYVTQNSLSPPDLQSPHGQAAPLDSERVSLPDGPGRVPSRRAKATQNELAVIDGADFASDRADGECRGPPRKWQESTELVQASSAPPQVGSSASQAVEIHASTDSAQPRGSMFGRWQLVVRQRVPS